ncbi:MAG: hypothetical protein PWQ16_291 [bacterium]|nr:hypothetical protein [bacterium]
MGYVLDVAIERPLFYCLSYFSPRKVDVGLRVKVPVGKSVSKGWVLSARKGEPSGLKTIKEIIDDVPPLPSSFLAFARLLSFEYCYPLGMTLKLLFPYNYLPSFGELGLRYAESDVFNKVVVGLRESRFAFYKDIISEFFKRGEKVLLVVPQVEDVEDWASRLSFEETYLWFSEMKRGERKKAWEAARREGKALFVGTSSLAFLPVRDLGLVIVDDEGSPYLRRLSPPYIHSREAVLLRRRIESFSVILGGLFPSLEAYVKLSEGWELEELPYKSPKLVVVDLRRSKKKALLSLSVFNKVKANLKNRRRSVLLLNRKAYASYLKCGECGYVPKCPNCDVPLSFHRDGNKLRCSYCGYEKPFFDKCFNCGGIFFKVGSPGIEQAKLLLEEKLGESVEVWDAEKKEDKEVSLVILGTQAVLQPKLMKDVSLACIVLADISLYVPSYRGEEDTLRLIYSVADFSPKEIFIQTYVPEHPVFKVFVEGSWKRFFQEELKKREELRYPPLYSMALISVEGKKEVSLRKKIKYIKEQIEEGSSLEVLGPIKKFVGGGKISLSLVIKGKKGKLQEELWKFLEDGKIKVSDGLSLVIDPVEV